jgi:hypothetical protein
LGYHPVTASDPLDEELADRRIAAGKNRIPPAVAVLFAAVVYALLPESLLVGPRFAIPIIELALLAAPGATNRAGWCGKAGGSRIAATALAGLVIVANVAALGMLIARLVASSTSGGSLLLGAMQAWITNVIGFGLLFWELDRGGPVARRKLPGKSCRRRTGGFPRTRTTTPWSKARPDRARSPAGSQYLSSTSMCP